MENSTRIKGRSTVLVGEICFMVILSERKKKTTFIDPHQKFVIQTSKAIHEAQNIHTLVSGILSVKLAHWKQDSKL